MRGKIGSIMVILLLGLTLSSAGQEKCKAEFNVNADVVSRYVWRGTQYGGDFPSVQPTLSVKMPNFTFGVWGSYSLSGSSVTQELDLFALYTFKDEMFTIGLTDYFFPNASVDYSYLDYGANSTGHVLEGSFTYNGVEKFPLSVMLAVNFFGADAARLDNDPSSVNFNSKTGIQYSNYLEFNYPWKVKDIDIKATAGITLSSPREFDASTAYIGESGYYASKAGVVNLGVKVAKELKLTEEFSLPLSGSFIVNPITKKVFYVISISF